MSEYRGKSYRCKDGIIRVCKFLNTGLFAISKFDVAGMEKIVRSFPVLLSNPNEFFPQAQLDELAGECGYQEVRSC